MATATPGAPKPARKPLSKTAPSAAEPVVGAPPETPAKRARAPAKAGKAAPAVAAEIVAVAASPVAQPVAAVEPAEPAQPVADDTLPTVDQPSIEERIRIAAYQRYEARGRVDGLSLEDWFEAERALVAQRA